MRKIIAFLVLGHFIAFGQNGNTNDENQKLYLPNIIPPSPEAFQITKYGDLPLDEFNGKVNLSVPIYEYKIGELKLPISLSYNGAGVKVKDIPTQVGINWTLNAGGLISREIRDLPDENSVRINLDPMSLNSLNKEDCTSQAATLRNYVDLSQYDTETDVFHFNFNGYSGSFYLDSNMIPKLTKNDNELKIEILGNLYNSKSFLITDANGVKYFFGGENNTESSTIENIVNGNHVNMGTSGGITSFYLYRVVHPINGEIYIEYETKASYNYVLSKESTKTKSSIEGFLGSFEEPNCSYPSDQYSDIIIKNYIDNPKYIKKIYSPNSAIEVIFDRINCNQQVSQLTNAIRTVLKNITIKNNLVVLQKTNLHYLGLDDLNNVKRFFLSEIQLNDIQDNNEKYNFDYNDPLSLPERFSNKIDLIGYFNNKNNQNLTPCFPTDNNITCPNRTTDFEYASKGVLKKVYYPTKGFTEFEYETQPFLEKKFTTISANTYSNNSGELNVNDNAVFLNGRYNKFHDELPKTYTDENGDTQRLFPMPLAYSQSVEIKLYANTTDNGPTFREAKAIMKIYDLTSNITTTYETKNNISFNYYFDANHTYEITIDLFLPNIVAQNASFGGYFTFNLHTGYHSTTGYGVRLKRTKDLSDTSAIPLVKRIYYKPYHKLNDLQADQFIFNNYPKKNPSIMICYLGAGWTTGGFSLAYNKYTVIASTMSSEYNYQDFTFNQLIRDYSTVSVSLGGDNFEQGGFEKTFGNYDSEMGHRLMPKSTNEFSNMLDPHISIVSKKANPIPLNGELLKEKTFINKNGVIYKINEKSFEFENTILDRKLNFFGAKLVSLVTYSGTCGQHNTLSNYNISYYNSLTYGNKKIKEKIVNYISPVPANLVPYEPSELDDQAIIYPTQEQLEAPYKKIITTQTYEYGTLKGLPTAITTSTSEDAIVNKTVNTYVNTASTLPNIPSTQAALYTSLLAQNRVGDPVQVQQFENSELLSTQRTLFKNWTIGSTNIILPEKIQISKGNQPLEDKALFYNYDAHFNPAVMGYAAAPKTKYIFNTNGLVVAKIENYIGTETSFPVITGNINNTNCALQTQNPMSQVTVFTYDLSTKKLLKITDSRCQNTFYVYDTLQRLQFVKDHDGNIVKEFDQQFKPQN
jgi:hypothetical protein